MKILKIIYWVTTGLVAFGMLVSFFNYMFNPVMKVGYAHIGFPDWFRVELGIAKLLGTIALIVPKIRGPLKNGHISVFSSTFSRLFSLIML